MADNVFEGKIKIADGGAEQSFARISQSVGRMTGALNAVREHTAGLAMVFKSAFGEAEHSARAATHEMKGAAEAVHNAGAELHKTAAAAHEVGHEIARSARLSEYETLAGHLTLLRSRFGNVRFGVGEFGNSMSTLLPVLGGLGVAGSLEQIFELVERTSESFSQLGNAAQSMGVSLQQLQGLDFAAKQADLPAETLRNAMFRLGYGAQDARTGRNKDLAGLFHHLGINPAEPLMPMMMQLADAMQKTTSPSMRQKMAEALFGRGGSEMIPFLSGGSAKLKEMFALSGQLNFTPSKEQREQLEEYHRSMVGLTTAVQGFRDAIGTDLAGVLRPVVDQMTKWIAANRDWIAQGLHQKIEQLGDALEHVDWQGIGEVLRRVGDDAKWLLDHVGGARGALEALIALKAVSWGAEWIGKFNEVALAIIGVTRAIKALDLAISGSTVGAAVAKMLPAATRLTTAAGAGLYAYFDPSQTESQKNEMARLRDALHRMHLPDVQSPDVRTLSDIIAAANALQPTVSGEPLNTFAEGYETPAQRFSRLLAAGAPAAGPVRGSVDVNVKIDGLGRNDTARVRSRGDLRTNIDVGRAMPGVGGYGDE